VDPRAIEALGQALAGAKRPLIVAGPDAARSDEDAEALWRFAEMRQIPVYCESSSGLRFDGQARPLRLCQLGAAFRLPKGALPLALPTDQTPDLLLRIGRQPAAFAFDELVQRLGAQLWIAEDGEPGDGASAATGLIQAPLAALMQGLRGYFEEAPTPASASPSALQRLDRRLAAFCAAWPEAAPAFDELGALSAALESCPSNSLLFVGNSLPIRLLDFARGSQTRDTRRSADSVGAEQALRVFSQRGLAGIDGLVAGAAGLSLGHQAQIPLPDSTGPELTLILGDLSLTHDLSSLPLLSAQNLRVRVLVLNNGGGRIFEALPAGRREDLREAVDQQLVRPLCSSFEGAAQQAGLGYAAATSLSELRAALSRFDVNGPQLIEARLAPHGAQAFYTALERFLGELTPGEL